jgi:hypothetical protein
MSRSRKPNDFESELIFHEREWRIQRIGWIVLTIFLALAFAGLFGGGPLSHARVGGATGSIEYEHFVRGGTSTDLVVTPAAAAAGVHRIEIPSDYLEAFRVESITPEPTAVRMSGESLVYEFAAGAHGSSISFHIHPQRLWRHRAVLRIDGAPLEIWQLTYP